MLYVLFLSIAIIYNMFKFRKERQAFLSSLTLAQSDSHRLMILGHHFYIFIFEAFLAIVVSQLIGEGDLAMGLLGMGVIYILLLFLGFFLYRFFVRYLERNTGLKLWSSFKGHIIKELRVSFAIILLPILIYSLINWGFQDNVYEEWGSLWFIGMLLNIIFVSLLTIACTVVIMLRLIPNREVTEPEYTAIINRRLKQVELEGMRVRWIETDIKNAFVVGMQLFQFSNQTMFVGKRLRTMLSLEEFDAVVSHELAHAANGHIQRRLMVLIKNFISIFTGSIVLMLTVMCFCFLYWGEDINLHPQATLLLSFGVMLGWFLINYALLFDTLRSQEYEADAYAVIEMGASLNAMKSALEKLTQPDEVPEYLKSKTRKKSRLQVWLARYFSTHPTIQSRFDSLEKKLHFDLPYNYYLSPVQQAHHHLSRFYKWHIFVPCTIFSALALVWVLHMTSQGSRMVAFIKTASPHEIMHDGTIVEKINSRPSLTGPSLMYYIVQRQNPLLIDYYLQRGADKGRTLAYITNLKDFEMLKKYYSDYGQDINDDEYYLILRKTASMNFTEAYRFLVNSQRFEELHPNFKQDISRIHQQTRTRRPAAVNE